jgi:hypothetical protein
LADAVSTLLVGVTALSQSQIAHVRFTDAERGGSNLSLHFDVSVSQIEADTAAAAVLTAIADENFDFYASARGRDFDVTSAEAGMPFSGVVVPADDMPEDVEPSNRDEARMVSAMRDQLSSRAGSSMASRYGCSLLLRNQMCEQISSRAGSSMPRRITGGYDGP